MKLSIVLASLVSICAIGALPVNIPKDNSHYVEGVSRYIWMPDDKGELHLVDLDEPVDPTVSARNGANNQYWLFTRQNPYNRQVLIPNDINSVRNSNYRANRPTKVVVHGWNGSGNSGMNPAITSAFLAIADVNVIVVDWNRLSNSNYISAANGVPGIGQHLGNFLIWLFDNAGGNWNNLHLVGFSLGAHVVGNAGRQAGGRPSRITGLDPAGPRWGGNNQRLQSNAGRYVEAIHTDGGTLGINDRSGDADFYPNGGSSQPGCGRNRGDIKSACSHSRATDLFAATVRYNRLVGRRCNDMRQAQRNECNGATLNMGNGVINKNGNGIYGLRTGGQWPF